MTIKEWVDITTLLSNIVGIFGIPIAIYIFFNEKRKERLDREYGTYNALDDKYVEYLTLCIKNPELDLYYVPLSGKPRELTEEQKVKQFALFEILLSQMERAFLMYAGHTNEFRMEQWNGWEAYMKEWVKRPIFGKLLSGSDGHQFDKGFITYLRDLHKLVAPPK